MKPKELASAIGAFSKTLLEAGFVLIFTITMVKNLINSGVNEMGCTSMSIAMARPVADTMGGIYPPFALSVGALGAFIAGSNTVSNMIARTIPIFNRSKFRIDWLHICCFTSRWSCSSQYDCHS